MMMVMGSTTPELCRFVGIWAVWLDTSEKLLCSCLVASDDSTRAIRNLDSRGEAKRAVGAGKRHVVQMLVERRGEDVELYIQK
jgi:hypothetical protein